MGKRRRMTAKLRTSAMAKASAKKTQCRKAYAPFEHKVEQLFAKEHLDVVATTKDLELDILKQLRKAVNPSGIQPHDDFYSYINDRWIEQMNVAEGQEYIVQVDDFRLTQDKVYRELMQLVRDYLASSEDAGSAKKASMRAAFASFQRYLSPADMRAKIDQVERWWSRQQEVWSVLGYFNRNELIAWGVPLAWSVNPDDKHPTTYTCYLDGVRFSLPDAGVYVLRDQPPPKYMAYLRALFRLSFGEDQTEYLPEHVFQVECDLMDDLLADTRTTRASYTLVQAADAQREWQLDWEAFCRAMQVPRVPGTFVTSDTSYVRHVVKRLLRDWQTPAWKTYWMYLFVRQYTRWTEEGSRLFFEFYGRELKGQDAPESASIRPIFPMAFLFNTWLSNRYVQSTHSPEAVSYVQALAEDLKQVFQRIIRRNTWMRPSTKRHALEKLDKLRLTIGSPPQLIADPLLEYRADDPWGNLEKKAHWRHRWAASSLGRRVIHDLPSVDWTQLPPKFTGTQSFVVNAFYTASENRIYVPLGYLQKPFVDLEERGIEYNLSRIGYTMAHEMSHALDDWGSQYNARGELHNWWTDADRKVYASIQRDIQRQYEEFAKRDGIEFDAAMSIGEDLADISGLAICLEYLRDFQLKNEDILPIQSLSFEAFFTYFAVQSRQKISQRAIQAQLLTNPHPLDKYRCNVPLSRSPLFRAIYHVRKGDGMWWHSTNRVWNHWG